MFTISLSYSKMLICLKCNYFYNVQSCIYILIYWSFFFFLACSNIFENRNPGNASHILTALPPPPTKSHRVNLGATIKQNSLSTENEISPSHQPPSQVKYNL